MSLPHFLTFGHAEHPSNATGARHLRLVKAEDPPIDADEEPKLLLQVLSDDIEEASAALERIFRAWYTPLLAFAHMISGVESDAQDLVQEVFVDIWNRRKTLRVSTSIAAYLHTAVRYRALTLRRNATTRNRLLGTIVAAEYPDGAYTPAASVSSGANPPTGDRWDTEELSTDERRFLSILTAADRLPPRAREVFYLRWRQGLSYKEIASVMSISVKTAEAQMTIAMRKIREGVRGG